MRLIYLSPVPWNSFPQRPHKFVEWSHIRHGAEVLWIEPYPTRLPTWHDFRRLHPDWNAGNSEVPRTPEWITVIRPFSLPVDPISGLDKINGLLWQRMFVQISDFLSTDDRCIIAIGKPSKLALRILQSYPTAMSIFDAMDDYPEFYKGYSKNSMELIINEIALQVSCILISSEALSFRFENQKSKLLLVRNACDTDAIPYTDTIKHRKGRPIFGYIGTIGHWFDWPLLIALAKADSCVHFRLLGPIYVPPEKPVPSNIELLPACDHELAMKIMQDFTVGLIPFKRNNLTCSVDPIKYYEYRSIGLPILSSRFGGMISRDGESGIFFIDKYADLALKIKQALTYQYQANEVQNFRNRNSWTKRFDECQILSG